MATEILYYPYMRPSEHWLRGALLFSDRIYTIVPRERQGLDWLSPDTREIINRLTKVAPDVKRGSDESSLAQIDPLEKYLYETSASALTAEVVRYYESNREAGHFDDVGVNRFLSLAAAKLPKDLLRWLKGRDLYVYVKQDPDSGRVHPNIGNYFMNRLASIVSSRFKVPCVTDRINDFACNALQGIDRPNNLEEDVQLLGWSLSFIVPEEIVELNAEAYLEVRETYKEITVDVSAMMNDLAVHHRIDHADTLDDVVRRLEQAKITIQEGIQRFINGRADFKAKKRKRMVFGGLIEAAKAIPVVGSAVGVIDRLVGEASVRPELPLTNSQALYSHLADRLLQVRELAEPIKRQLATPQI